MKNLILAVDQGTTGSTALLIDHDLNIIGRHSVEIPLILPQSGWVEHDYNTIYQKTMEAMQGAIEKSGRPASSIAAIGITNQRETVGCFDRKTGEPLANAIVWQCRRTAEFCQNLKKRGIETEVTKKTGLLLDPYFSGSKMHWLMQNNQQVQSAIANGSAVFGTVDSYLLHRFTGGKVFATDATNASRTLLMNIESLEWDESLLETFSVPANSLPEIRGNAEVYGKTLGIDFLPDGIPVAALFGDQQAALFGNLCLNEGEAKITYGTGSFLLMNIGEKPYSSQNKLLTTVAWKLPGITQYAFEGSVFMAGAAVQWLRDSLGIIENAGDIESMAKKADDTGMGELVFVPAMTGLGAPYWRAHAKGTITGITRSTTMHHIARATLEGIAHQNTDVLLAMHDDLGEPLKTVKVDGGAAANDFLMQLQSDFTDIKIQRPEFLETTALGSGMAAGLAVGIWSSLDDLKKSWKLDKEFEPRINADSRSAHRNRWLSAVEKC